MSTKQSKYLVNLNRFFILALTLVGMFMDGYQGADIPIGLALVFWLWLPACTELEEQVVKYIDGRRQHGAEVRPHVWTTATRYQQRNFPRGQL